MIKPAAANGTVLRPSKVVATGSTSLDAFDMRSAILVNQARAMLTVIPVGMGGGIVFSALFVWILHPDGGGLALDAWWLWMLVAQLGRVALWSVATKDPDFAQNAGRWLRWMRGSLMLVGLSWAMLPALAPGDPLGLLLATVAIAGNCGVAVAHLSADPLSAQLFMIPPALSMSYRLLMSNDPRLHSLVVVGLLYVVVLNLATRRNHRSFLRLSSLHARAQRKSLHDGLTGLPNRLLLMSRIEQALDGVKSGEMGALMFLDLDGFKAINDTLGHRAGDEVLVAVSRRIRARLRACDTLARLGGDEFVILLEDVADASAVRDTARDVIHLLASPFDLSSGQTVRLGTSIGIATFATRELDAGQLLLCADKALYQAKAAGKGGFRFCERSHQLAGC
jgi:diguanylate cyclase (GGDEF)-like protein